MQIKQITSGYAVSPQIDTTDFAALAEAGFKAVICNRPDVENPPELSSDPMSKAAEAAGLAFLNLPITHQTLTAENAARQAEFIENATGPVLAYCASGTRSTIVWALGQSGKMSADEIVAAAANAGYDVSGIRGALA